MERINTITDIKYVPNSVILSYGEIITKTCNISKFQFDTEKKKEKYSKLSPYYTVEDDPIMEEIDDVDFYLFEVNKELIDELSNGKTFLWRRATANEDVFEEITNLRELFDAINDFCCIDEKVVSCSPDFRKFVKILHNDTFEEEEEE